MSQAIYRTEIEVVDIAEVTQIGEQVDCGFA